MTHPVPNKAIEILKSGGTTEDVLRAGILTTKGGRPAARTLRDWAVYVRRGTYRSVDTLLDPDSFTAEDVADGRAFSLIEPIPTTQVSPIQSVPGKVGLRSAVFDIEVASLQAGGPDGYLICACILPLDGSPLMTFTLTFDDRGDDVRLLREFISELNKFDIIIGHNSHMFDSNWLYTRAAYHDITWSSIARTWLSMDTYQMAKNLALSWGKSLGALSDFFDLEDGKLIVRQIVWKSVQSPHKDIFDNSMNQIAGHCQQDVILTRSLFDFIFADSLTLSGAGPMKVSKLRIGVPDHVSRG